MDTNGGSIVISSSDEESESDSTDYEPDTKRSRFDEVPPTPGSKLEEYSPHGGRKCISRDAEIETDQSLRGVEDDDGEDGNDIEDASPENDLSPGSPSPSSSSSTASSLSHNSMPKRPNLLTGRQQPKLDNEEEREGSRIAQNTTDTQEFKTLEETEDVVGNSNPTPDARRLLPVTPSPCSSQSWVAEDIDDLSDIPSDLEFSPPHTRPPTPRPLSYTPTPPLTFHPFQARRRERRNAIFQLRSPPAFLQQNEDDQYFQDELEVASVSDINENPIEDANSTSGTETVNHESSVLGALSETCPGTQEDDRSDNNFADAENMLSAMEESEVDSDETGKSSVRSRVLNSSDSEISEKDKWFCTQCHAKSTPYFRYCLRCFKIRRNWLPQRPPSRRLKRRKAEQRRNNLLNTSRTTVSSDSEQDVVDSGRQNGPSANEQSQQQPSGQPPSQEAEIQGESEELEKSVRSFLPAAPPVNLNDAFLVDNANPSVSRIDGSTPPGNVTLMELFPPVDDQIPEPKTESQNNQTQTISISSQAPTEVDSVDTSSSQQPNSQSQSTSSSQSQPSLHSQPSSQSPDFLSPPNPLPKSSAYSVTSVCNVCYVRAKDAAFVHNRIAHQYCCYTCADKILKKDGKCPICRERVLRVVRVIVL